MILRARDAGSGIDDFYGYEVSFCADRNVLLLGKHRKNWEHIRDVPFEAPINEWIPLVVRMSGRSLEVVVNGRSVATYEDTKDVIEAGTVALRPFGRSCRYRNLWVSSEGKREDVPFEPATLEGYGELSGMWRGINSRFDRGAYSLIAEKPFVGAQSQRVSFREGEVRFGIENRGLNRWGMNYVAGKQYEGRIWFRSELAVDVWVSAESADGERVYDETRLKVAGGNEWTAFDFALTPSQGDTAGRFAISLKNPGTVDIGYVSLQPGDWGRFKGLPVRKDVSEYLIAQNLTVLRYGGSMVNAKEYRWKKMIGPRDKRPPYAGTWYPYSTNGWGIIDFIELCDACGFLGVPALNMGETPEDMADFVEYVNGSATSAWGGKRAEAGHPEPYRLKYVELGNEEKVDEEYFTKFRPLAEAIWKKDPGITIVVGDFMYGKVIEDPFKFEGSPVISSLAAQKKILEFAKANGKPVWFDVHIGNNEPHEPNLAGTKSFIDALGKLCPGADYKVVVFEENSSNHAIRRALGHANAIMQLERLSDRVPILCAANCLQPYRQNDNDWDQGMVFLTPGQVWGQPPYYVTQMIAGNYLPSCVAVEVAPANEKLMVTATTNEGKSALVVQMLNISDKAVNARLEVEGFSPTKPTVTLSQLSGMIDDVNTPEEPKRIVPKESTIAQGLSGGKMTVELPARSFSLLRFE